MAALSLALAALSPPPGPCEPAAEELPGRQQLPHRLLLRQRPRHPTAAGDLATAPGTAPSAALSAVQWWHPRATYRKFVG